MPPIQKRLIRACRAAGKPVIVATQMLESMITAPVPTRAEVSDVATAIYEGADAIMLSAESAAGDYPIEAVTTMNNVAEAVENDRHLPPGDRGAAHRRAASGVSDAITVAAREVAETTQVKAICCFSHSGTTALLAARERPRVPIIALTPLIGTARRLALTWGLHCVVVARGRPLQDGGGQRRPRRRASTASPPRRTASSSPPASPSASPAPPTSCASPPPTSGRSSRAAARTEPRTLSGTALARAARSAEQHAARLTFPPSVTLLRALTYIPTGRYVAAMERRLQPDAARGKDARNKLLDAAMQRDPRQGLRGDLGRRALPRGGRHQGRLLPPLPLQGGARRSPPPRISARWPPGCSPRAPYHALADAARTRLLGYVDFRR